MFLLLPPSEGKAEGGTPRSAWTPRQGAFGKALHAKREDLVKELFASSGGDPALLGVKGKHLERAKTANAALMGACTLRARERYTGVVWGYLQLSSLTSRQQDFADEHIIVLSGLLGAVVASDPVPDYRLKMGGRLGDRGVLSKWWREDLSHAINAHCAGHIVVDLLPGEHRSAFVPDLERLRGYVALDLMTKKDGKAGGHDAKAAKGLLARHLISHESTINQKDGASLKKIEAAIEKFTHDHFHVVTKVN